MTSAEGFRLSAQQREGWALWGSDRALRAWCALRIDGRFDAAALRRSAEDLVRAHEILRTTFHGEPGMKFPLQVVAEEASGRLSWDETSCRASDPLRAADELLSAERAAARGADESPVLRIRLGTLSEETSVLLFTLPGLTADRRTLHLIARHLAESLAGGAPRADAPAIQYADYSQWQEDLSSAADGTPEAAASFWGKHPSREQPGARRLGLEGFEGFEGFDGFEGGIAGRRELVLEPAAVARIDAISAERSFSAGDFLLACWQTLLARTTGEPEVSLATIEEARGLEDLQGALGLFSRALPVVQRVDGDAPLSDLARANAGARARNEEWQEYSGRDSGRDPGGDPRAGTPGFEYFERPDLPAPSGIAVSILGEFAPSAAFPLRLSCEREAGAIRIVCSAVGPAGDGIASRLMSLLRPLVGAAVQDPESPAGALPLLSAAERRRLLDDWALGPVDRPRSHLVHELFEEQAALHPDFPAVVCGEDRLTYGELNRRSNSLAWLLKERGVGPDVPVGLAVDRSTDAVVALLAILKAGGAYLPLNPEHPAARLELQLAQSGSKLLLTHSKWIAKASGFTGETIALDSGGVYQGREDDPPRDARPSHLAYVMYTSGSTGVPKGVEVRHSSLANYADAISGGLLGIDPRDETKLAFAAVSTISADLGNTAIFPSLVSGGCLHLVEYETAMDGARFADYAARHPVDVLKIVPSHFAALLDSGGGAAILPRRFLILGGEALSWELVERIRALSPACRIVNHYGPTETTVGSLTHPLGDSESRGAPRTVPIGRPIANTQVFLLDDRREPVPAGVPGELYIGGAGVARGYVHQPAETDARFVPNPFSGTPGARLYRTGDRARFLSDGSVEFLGRVDDQVKIRGFRIEPGEIRAVLAAQEKVRECVVLVREDAPGDARIAAYVVAARGATVSSDDLRAWARSHLPEYMVPSAFVAMRTLPLTPNGKIDRGALPAPDPGAGDAYVAPRTAAERTVAEIWREVLKVDRVGVADNFFDLGGHSLLLTQVVSRLRRTFETELPIRWLFETPTVEGLAARIEAAEREDLGRILDEIEALPEDGAHRLEKLRE